MKTLFWELLARLGFWIPCNKYMPNPKYWNWVLISSYEKGSIIRNSVFIARYYSAVNEWHLQFDDGYRSEIVKSMDEILNNLSIVTHWHKLPNDKYLKIR